MCLSESFSSAKKLETEFFFGNFECFKSNVVCTIIITIINLWLKKYVSELSFSWSTWNHIEWIKKFSSSYLFLLFLGIIHKWCLKLNFLSMNTPKILELRGVWDHSKNYDQFFWCEIWTSQVNDPWWIWRRIYDNFHTRRFRKLTFDILTKKKLMNIFFTGGWMSVSSVKMHGKDTCKVSIKSSCFIPDIIVGAVNVLKVKLANHLLEILHWIFTNLSVMSSMEMNSVSWSLNWWFF